MRVTPTQKGLGFWNEGAVTGHVPWQMVPLGGARGLKLAGAKGLEIRIESDPPGKAGGLTYSETKLHSQPHREIWLQGRAAGRYVVSTGHSGAKAARLEAEVFEQRTIRIAYY